MALVVFDDFRRNRVARDSNRPLVRMQNPSPSTADVQRALTSCPFQCWVLDEDGALSANPNGRFDCEACRGIWGDDGAEEDVIMLDLRATGSL